MVSFFLKCFLLGVFLLEASDVSAGFLVGSYNKMLHEADMVNFAKSHKPIKTKVYHGCFMLCPTTGQNSSLRGAIALYFYSNGVLKVNGKYYIPAEKSEDESQTYFLPTAHKLYGTRGVTVLLGGEEINYVEDKDMFGERFWFVHYYSLSGGSSGSEMNNSFGQGGYSNGQSGNSASSTGRKCTGCNGTGKCKACHGEGEYWEEVGMFTGTDTHKKVICPVCNGSRNCKVCYGRGSL